MRACSRTLAASPGVKTFPEAATNIDKLVSDHLKKGSRWVDETGRVVPFSEEEKKAVETSQAFESEASYLLNQEGLQTGFVLDFKPGAKLAQTERQLREVVLQQRKPEQQEQKGKKLKNSKMDKVRRKLLQKWRENKGSKTARKELLSVVPRVGPKDKNKKKGKKPSDSSKPSAVDKPSSQKHRLDWKKKERQQRAAGRQHVCGILVEGLRFRVLRALNGFYKCAKRAP